MSKSVFCQKKKRAYLLLKYLPLVAAVSAVCLMLIHKAQGITDPAVYVSIGGVANQQTIDRLKRKIPSVLAVDNDPAGDECRARNPDLPTLIPVGKDWNDDLRNNSRP